MELSQPLPPLLSLFTRHFLFLGQVSRARADLIQLREARILGPAAGSGGCEIVRLLRPVPLEPNVAAAPASVLASKAGSLGLDASAVEGGGGAAAGQASSLACILLWMLNIMCQSSYWFCKLFSRLIHYKVPPPCTPRPPPFLPAMAFPCRRRCGAYRWW